MEELRLCGRSTSATKQAFRVYVYENGYGRLVLKEANCHMEIALIFD